MLTSGAAELRGPNKMINSWIPILYVSLLLSFGLIEFLPGSQQEQVAHLKQANLKSLFTKGLIIKAMLSGNYKI